MVFLTQIGMPRVNRGLEATTWNYNPVDEYKTPKNEDLGIKLVFPKQRERRLKNLKQINYMIS